MSKVILFSYIGVMCLISFILFGVDKAKAKRHAWRIPEKVLFGSAFIGGALGALIGMQVYRHKTKHLSFKILIPLFLVLNIVSVFFIFRAL